MENQNPQDVAQSQQIPHIAVPIPPKKRKTWVIVVMILIGLAVLCCAIFGALILFVFNTVSKGADEAKSITSAACQALSSTGTLQSYLTSEEQSSASDFNYDMHNCVGFSSISQTSVVNDNGRDYIDVTGDLKYKDGSTLNVSMQFLKEDGVRKISGIKRN